MHDGSRKHGCGHCSKAYTKAEHLHRHERSHTGDKPFSCPDCHQRFTRFDSLSRHQSRSGHSSRPKSAFTTSHGEFSTDQPQNFPLGSDISTTPSGLSANGQPVVSGLAAIPDLQAESIANESLGNIAFQEEAGDLFAQLTWPDSEALLQSILNTNLQSWPQPFETLASQYLLNAQGQAQQAQNSPWLIDHAEQDSSGGRHAIRNISQIISDLSATLTSEAESTALSTVFLEACLHVFFEQFTASFPICHRSTFVFRDWTHPLLLTAIALGSLFVGQDINVTKGEVLWTLAHTAVATSWHSLIQHKGPYDSCYGVQIVMTAVLGQTYAMLSGTGRLRTTAQIFHSLGFYWAQQCDMYSNTRRVGTKEVTNANSEARKQELWRSWAAEEVQLRALLGHYILDGILTYFTGAPTCQRHASNPLSLPSSERLFEAASLDEWVEVLQKEPENSLKFREVLLDLFENSAGALHAMPLPSLLTVQVILEGIQSFVTDLNIVGDPVVGSPPRSAIESALYSLYTFITTSIHFSDGEKTLLLLRWHTICIDATTNFNRLCRYMCSHFSIEQAVFGKAKGRESYADLKEWVKKPQARRALLHALAIKDLSKKLPIGQTCAIHVPICLFAAATVYAAFVLGGASSTQVPRVHQWKPLLIQSSSETMQSGNYEDLQLFNYIMTSASTSKMHGANLLYDVNAFVLLLKQIRRPWGICADLESILLQWLSKCGI